MLYVFDAVLMYAICAIPIAMHPGGLIKQAHQVVKATRVSMLDLEDNTSNIAITAFSEGKQVWIAPPDWKLGHAPCIASRTERTEGQ
jgi:hypothetical protein